MRKSTISKIVAFTGAAVLVMGSLAGCGNSAEVAETTGDVVAGTENAGATETAEAETTKAPDKAEETPAAGNENESTAETETTDNAPYFTKGVYVNYAEGATTRDYFYVFHDETTGYTEDGNNGMGLPFVCEQEDGRISFTFGGEGEEPEVLTVTSTENGIITGAFDDGKELHFELCQDADPDNFSAENYINPASEAVYEDANGWTVKYNSDLFEVNKSDNIVTFVYTGESAGTNMITVTYDVDTDAKGAIEKIAESWGDENVYKTEGPFPGTENVNGYFATLPPAEGGSGLYESAVARDYMDGYLMFECTGHNSGDEEKDMEISDTLASIIDSLQFPAEQ